MRRSIAAAAVVTGLLATAAPADAQAPVWEDRYFINVSVGLEANGHLVDNFFTFTRNGEEGFADARRAVNPGPLFDVTGGGRFWKNIGAALSVSGRSKNVDVDMVASVPHPVVFNQPRAVTQPLADLKYSETVVAPLVVYGFRALDVLDVLAFAGPAVRSVDEEIVSEISIAEGVGGPAVTPTRTIVSKSFWGGQFGLDVRYLFTPNIGAGGFLRYTGAGGNLTNEITLESSGVELGFGVRVRY
jgi:opacity protein-like surface antigen